MFFKSEFYLQHRGLIVNLSSLLLFFLVLKPISAGGVDDMGQSLWLSILVLLAIIAEPWAVYYSMGVMNSRREAQNLKPNRLQSWIYGVFGIIVWGGRLSIFGALIMSNINKWDGPELPEIVSQILAVVFFILLFAREVFIVYHMGSKKAFKSYKASYDFLADLILIVVLSIGEMLVNEVFKDVGIHSLDSLKMGPIILFPILLFTFVFYLPIRYIHTLEDFTFARTKWQYAERILSFLLVLFAFLFLR